MLTDLQQPTKHWLADAVQNFKQLLGEEDDPSFTVELNGCVIEIRLNEAPGVFSRRTVTLESQSENRLRSATSLSELDCISLFSDVGEKSSNKDLCSVALCYILGT